MKFYHYLLFTFIFIYSNSCKKEENKSTTTYQSSFTANTTTKITPNAFLRKEGYDQVKNIYYLSLTFATGAVTYDTSAKKVEGYGEAVRYYIYSPSLTEIPNGKYTFVDPISSSDLFFKTQKIEVFSNNYSFNYTTNQKGFLYNKTKSGSININRKGLEYDISYEAIVGYSNGNIYEPVQLVGNFKGKLIK